MYFRLYCHHKCACFTDIKRHILEIAEKHARYKILLTEYRVRKFMYFGTFHFILALNFSFFSEMHKNWET